MDVVPRRVSCVGRRRPGGVSRGNRGSNVFALVRVRFIRRLRKKALSKDRQDFFSFPFYSTLKVRFA